MSFNHYVYYVEGVVVLLILVALGYFLYALNVFKKN